MSAEVALFWLFAILTCAGAISVAVSQNVVRMAFALVLTLGATAVLFLLLGADFVGATQLLVYVGGTLVLLVFGVMLTASGPFTRIKSSAADAILPGLIGVVFLYIVSFTVGAVDWDVVSQRVAVAAHASADQTGFNPEQQGNTTRPLGMSFLSLRVDKDLNLKATESSATADSSGAQTAQANSVKPLSTGYLLPFEIVSVHLLVVLVGAAYLARTKRRVTATN